METVEQCMSFCNHITALTGTHCTLLNILAKDFQSPPFRNGCALASGPCSASRTHLFGAYEAQRWEGKYLYYCPRGLAFIAAVLYSREAPAEHCVIAGPIIMTAGGEEAFEDPLKDSESLRNIPRMTTAQVRALSEVISTAVSPFPREADSILGNSAVMMQIMYDYTVDVHPKDYPIESERQLQAYIREGNKESAQKLLNELLAKLYASTGNDLNRTKPRIRELLVLMNRAAIDGGADIDEIFNLCCRYELELDSFQQIEELNRWLGMILHQFIGFVFDFNAIKHQNVIFKATAYIKEHLTERISLEQAAAQVYLSKSYFCRILKNELGCTFTEYVNQLRIERSKALLHSSRMAISEISSEVGFEDQSYFTRIFKKQTGLSPGKYRELKGPGVV